MSIRFKLTLYYSTILAVILIVMGGTVYLFQSYKAYSDVKNKLEVKGNDLGRQIEQYSNFLPGLLQVDPSSLQQEEFYIQIVDYRLGPSIEKSDRMKRYGLEFPYMSDLSQIKKAEMRKVNVRGFPFYVFELPVVDQNQKVVGLLQVGSTIIVQENTLHQLRTILVFTSLIGLVVAFTVGMLMARQSLRPIEIVIQAAEQIENGADLSRRIAWQGHREDELGRLTETLNGMLGRMELAYNELDEAYDAQRRFVSDASHELRTPLTTIRGNIDLLEKIWKPALGDGVSRIPEISEEEAMRQEMSREAMQDIGDEARRMSRLVNDLLALARADAGFVMEMKPVELAPLVEEVVRRASMLPRTASWLPGDLSKLEGIGVMGNEDYLRQLLFIFIENAFKYTPEGSVTLGVELSGQQAGIVIRDTGLGMEQEQVPHIFQRFYRADESRGMTSGTGLGLSIAKWIIDEHGGSVEVHTSPGVGSAFTIWLPVAFSVHVE